MSDKALNEREMRMKIRNIDEEIEKRINEQLERIKRINFFKPERNLEVANSIVPKVDELIDKYINALRPYKKGNTRWKKAEYAAETATIEAIEAAWNIDAALDAPMKVVDEAPIKTAYAGRDAAALDAERDWRTYGLRYMAWEIVRDLPGFENNPFDYVIQLYELGLKPTGFRNVDGEERYVVDIPLIIDGKRLLGCYAHRDKEILWIHEWEDYCTNLKPKPLKFHIRKIEW